MKIKNLMTENVITIDKNQSLNDGLKLLRKYNISRLPVVNEVDGKKALVGIVSERNIADKLGSLKSANMSTSRIHISSVMVKDVIVASEDESLQNVAKIMLDNHIGSVPIESDGEMTGIVSKADFTTLATGRVYEKLFVKDSMTASIISVSPSDRLVHARRVMSDNSIGRLPVVSDEEIVGMLTSKDLMRALIDFKNKVHPKHQNAQIKNLLVNDIMSSPALTTSEDATIDEVATIMGTTGYNGLPVVSDGEIKGIITKTDILALIVDLESK